MKLSERLRLEASLGNNVYNPWPMVALKKAADMLEECERALAFYAENKNWHYNSELDPCSANFTGGPAKTILAKLRAQEKAGE